MSRQCHHLVGGVFSLVLIQIGGRVSDVFGALPANVIGIVFYVLFLYDGFLHPPISCTMVIFVMFMGTSCFRNVSATTEASKLPKPHERAAFIPAFVPDDHTPENREPCSRALTSRCKKLRSVNFIDRGYIFCKYFKYISNNTSCGQAFKKDKGGKDMNINGLSSGFQIYAGLNTQAKISATQEEPTDAQAITTDTVEISSQAKLLAQNTGTEDLAQTLMNSFMDGAGNDGVITMDEILAFGEKYQEKTEQILDETLDALGLSSNEKITISSDTEGNIVVSSDLSEADNETLEQALNDHPDFQQDYAKAASALSLYNA